MKRVDRQRKEERCYMHLVAGSSGLDMSRQIGHPTADGFFERAGYQGSTRVFRCFLLAIVVLLARTSMEGKVLAQEMPFCACEVGPLDCSSGPAVAEESRRYLESQDCANKCQSDEGCQRAFFRIEQILQGCPIGTVQARVSFQARTFEEKCSRCREYPMNQPGEKFCPSSLPCNNETEIRENLTFLRQSCRGPKGCRSNLNCEQSWYRLYALEFTCGPEDISPTLRDSIRSWSIQNCQGGMCNLDKRDVFFGPECQAGTESFSNGVSAGAAAGIAVGALVAAILVAGVTTFALKRRRNKSFQPFE